MANIKKATAAKKAASEKETAIEKNMKILGITRAEAEEMWAFDHDEIDCEEVDAIEAKIDTNKQEEKKKRKSSPLDKVRNMQRKKKADAEKTSIINAVFEFLRGCDKAVNPQEMATTKMSFMGEDGGFYTVTITKHKTCPDGYEISKEN